MTKRIDVTISLVVPGSTWIPHGTGRVIIAETEAAAMKQVAEAEKNRIRIVIGQGRNVVVFRRVVDLYWLTCHGHPDRWPFVDNIPDTVGLAASGTVATLFSAVGGDDSNIFSAGTCLIVNKGPCRYYSTSAASFRVYPVGNLVGLVVFQGVLKGVAHRLLFLFEQLDNRLPKNHISR